MDEIEKRLLNNRVVLWIDGILSHHVRFCKKYFHFCTK